MNSLKPTTINVQALRCLETFTYHFLVAKDSNLKDAVLELYNVQVFHGILRRGNGHERIVFRSSNRATKEQERPPSFLPASAASQVSVHSHE